MSVHRRPLRFGGLHADALRHPHRPLRLAVAACRPACCMGFSPPLIDAERLTVPGLLKQHGYHTACIGKWHLGMTLAAAGGKTNDLTPADSATARRRAASTTTSASAPRWTCRRLRSSRTTASPRRPAAQRNGCAPARRRRASRRWTCCRRSRGRPSSIIGRAGEAGKPFFLYLPLTSPHTPIVPTKEWQGKSGLKPYGDFVMQTDGSVGQVLDGAGEEPASPSNTLVIFTSDNGCSPAAEIPELEAQGPLPQRATCAATRRTSGTAATAFRSSSAGRARIKPGSRQRPTRSA